jgi:secreted trypsin-like serine protease
MENEQLTVLGFGGFPQNNNNRDLEAAFMRVTTNQRCLQVNNNQVNPLQQFCAVDVSRRSDFCFDDMGGAVISVVRGQEVLVGIQSVQRCQTNPTAELLPSLFTRISGYRVWIRDTMLALN